MSYIEYIVSRTNRNYNLEENDFKSMLSQVSKNSNVAPTTRRFTRYLHRDLVYENNGVDQVKTWRKTPVVVSTFVASSGKDDREILLASYNRDKIPSYMFPSTWNIYDDADVTKTTFCLHKNVYISFECAIYRVPSAQAVAPLTVAAVADSGQVLQVVYKVSVNCSKDPKDDTKTISSLIDRAISLLQWVPTLKTDH